MVECASLLISSPTPCALAQPRVHVGQIESVIVAVDFERDAVEAGRLNQGLDVDAVRLAAQNLAPRRVADGVDERARHGGQHARPSSPRPLWSKAECTDATTKSSAARRRCLGDRGGRRRGCRTSIPARIVMPSTRAFTSRMRAAWASAPGVVEAVGHGEGLRVVGDGRCTSGPPRAPRFAIVSISWRPSDAVVCMCTSPLQILERDQAGAGCPHRRHRTRRGTRGAFGSIHGKPRAA